MKPHGSRTRDDERPDERGSARLRHLLRGIAVAVLLAFCAFAWWYSSRASGQERRLQPRAMECRMHDALSQQ